ncbi:hypothetical protein [Bradyrhizobium sp. BR 1432]|uniref:hypothetical protein n=1 Tax=Bradyrhizobium sp. BR 1432 TaxID=3447966 RepID=UPI003EE60127
MSTSSRKTADQRPTTLTIVMAAVLRDSLRQRYMIKTFRNASVILTFVAVTGGSSCGSMNNCFAFGLALVASFTAGSCIERILLNRAYREMVRLYGAEWSYADYERPGPLTTLLVATLAIFTIRFFGSDPGDLP